MNVREEDDSRLPQKPQNDPSTHEAVLIIVVALGFAGVACWLDGIASAVQVFIAVLSIFAARTMH